MQILSFWTIVVYQENDSWLIEWNSIHQSLINEEFVGYREQQIISWYVDTELFKLWLSIFTFTKKGLF